MNVAVCRSCSNTGINIMGYQCACGQGIKDEKNSILDKISILDSRIENMQTRLNEMQEEQGEWKHKMNAEIVLANQRLCELEDSKGYAGAIERQLAHVDNVLSVRIHELEYQLKNHEIFFQAVEYRIESLERENEDNNNIDFRIVGKAIKEFSERLEALEKNRVTPIVIPREYDERITALEKESPRLWNTEQTGIINYERITKLEKERDLGVERIKKLEEQNAKRMHECVLNARRLSELEGKEPILTFAAIEGVTPEVKIYNEKKQGLTFVEALKYFYEGKKIKPKSFDDYICINEVRDKIEVCLFSVKDWMVLDD